MNERPPTNDDKEFGCLGCGLVLLIAVALQTAIWGLL